MTATLLTVTTDRPVAWSGQALVDVGLHRSKTVLCELQPGATLNQAFSLGVIAGRAQPTRTMVVPPATWRGDAGPMALVARAQGVIELSERRLVTRALIDVPLTEHAGLWLSVALGLWAVHRLPRCPPVPEELGL